MTPEKKQKWTSYNNWSKKGPYLVLIIDCEWWDSNRPAIDRWFEANCPDCKPEPSDTMIRFEDQSQFTLWRLSWSP